jgi:hypothetical protein
VKETFKVFFERRERNRLRKQELQDAGVPNYKDWVEQEKENLPPEQADKIKKMEELKVPSELINKFQNAKKAEYEKSLKSDYFRKKVEGNLLFNLSGIKVYVDQYVDQDFSENSLNYRTLKSIIKTLVIDYKDLIPNRKPKIVVTNTKLHPSLKNVNIVGGIDSPPGAYQDRIIYLDQFHVDNINILIHEYAHFLSDRMSKQVEPFLRNEYKKMLDEFFERKTRRKNLEGKRNEKLREQLAKKMGLPSDYAATNFDEWFAELITHWKKLLKDRASYRFKQILKKVITRL